MGGVLEILSGLGLYNLFKIMDGPLDPGILNIKVIKHIFTLGLKCILAPFYLKAE